jgi:hypothetical protein
MADFVMEKIAHADELKVFMEKFGLSSDEVCIVGSAVMAAAGIRENDDLEVILIPSAFERVMREKGKKVGTWGHVKISEKLDLFHNIYGLVGAGDALVFGRCSKDCGLCRLADLELQYCYKKKIVKLMNREKDRADVKLLEQLFTDEHMNEYIKAVPLKKSSALWYNTCRQLREKGAAIKKKLIRK